MNVIEAFSAMIANTRSFSAMIVNTRSKHGIIITSLLEVMLLFQRVTCSCSCSASIGNHACGHNTGSSIKGLPNTT